MAARAAVRRSDPLPRRFDLSSVSPDERWALGTYADPPVPGMAVVPIDGTGPVRRFPYTYTPGQSFGPRWAPGGTAIEDLVFRDRATNLWRFPLDGSAPRPVTTFTSEQIMNYRWSPDGKTLAMSRGTDSADVVLITSEEIDRRVQGGTETVRLIPIAASLLALLLAQPASAQEQRGAIEGTVQDAQQAVLPGATIAALNLAQGSVGLDDRRRDRHVPLSRARSRVLRRHRLPARIHRGPSSSAWKSCSDRSSGSRSCSRLQESPKRSASRPPRRSWTRARARAVFSLRQDTIDLLPKGRDFTSLVS